MGSQRASRCQIGRFTCSPTARMVHLHMVIVYVLVIHIFIVVMYVIMIAMLYFLTYAMMNLPLLIFLFVCSCWLRELLGCNGVSTRTMAEREPTACEDIRKSSYPCFGKRKEGKQRCNQHEQVRHEA